MNDRVTLSVDEDGVAQVRLNRADKMNALDQAMFEGLASVGEKLRTMPHVRAVVIAGEGRAFCAGLDMGSFQRMSQADSSATPAKDLEVRTHGDTVCARLAAGRR